MTLLRYLWGLVFSIFAFGAFFALLGMFPLINHDWRIYQWCLLGMLAYIAFMGISNVFFQQNLKFFRTFTHELIHTIFTILSFKRIRKFQATSHQGGEIHVVGGGNMLILLSPYCIPIYTLFLLLFQPLFQAQFLPYIQFGIGLTYLFHLHTNWLQTGWRQTDISKYPALTSYTFILWIHCFFLGILLWSFQKGIAAFWEVPLMAVEKLRLAITHFLMI